MNAWLSKDFVSEINEYSLYSERSKEDFKEIEFSKSMSRPSKELVLPENYKNLNILKDQISTIRNWDHFSRLLNPYEKISRVSGLPIASRAFYKLYEILKFHNTKYNYSEEIKSSFHFCEAPGGFIQATTKLYPNINWYAQSLYTDNALIIDRAADVKDKWIRDGDSTGNLYNIENILAIKNKFKNNENDGIDLITADGGFNTSGDPNTQEQQHTKLITAEIIAALNVQKIGENSIFICKLFDTVTKPSCQLLVLLKKYYKTVYLIKPRTSRFSNSEKYVVSYGFNGIPENELNLLNNILRDWPVDQYIRNFDVFIPEGVIKDIYLYNDFLINNQSKYISQSLKCPSLSRNQINNLEILQNKRANEFCIAFLFSNSIENIKCDHVPLDIESEFKKCKFCDKLFI